MHCSFTQIFTLIICFIFSASSSTFQNNKNAINRFRPLLNDQSHSKTNDSSVLSSQSRNGDYFGARNIFLQPQEKYVLVPALLFGTESSFEKEYKLQIVQNISKKEEQSSKQQPALFQIFPALQKLNSYNLTAVKGLNVTDCGILEVYFEDDDTPYIVCLRKSRQLEVHRIDISEIYFEFSFRVSYLWNKMNVISIKQIFFYNASSLQFYTYDQETDTLIVKAYTINQEQSIKECETYIEDSPNQAVLSQPQEITQQRYYQICYTNNNQVSQSNSHTLKIIPNQIKKENVIMFSIDSSTIELLTLFQIPQKNASTFNHIVGFQIIDSLEKVIMLCYNLYKIESFAQKVAQQTFFVSSYCSIFKIYLKRNQMVLINRMHLENTTLPLLQISLQISVMLTVATQTSITFYHVDVLKQRFEFIQQIYVPEKSNFNCYEMSLLSNSYSSVSLTCAKDQDQTKTVSFVMIFDEDLGRYVPVGDVFVGVDFFHSAQLIFTLNQKELTVLKANQQYAIFDYSESKIEVRVYEVDIEQPEKRCRYASIIMNPAEYSEVYMDEVLPLIQEINYDEQFELSLRGAFQGSNISYLLVTGVDEQGNPVDNGMIKNEKIFFYDYSLLVSVYIKENCIRIIKICDVSFYRILQIDKSRVDQTDDNMVGTNNDIENSQDNTDSYYYYTEICSKLEGSYVCQLSEVHSQPGTLSSQKHQSSNHQPDVLRIESTQQKKLISIEYLSDSNTFAYLYQLIYHNLNGLSTKFYGIMFVGLNQQASSTSALECFPLEDFIQKIISTEDILKVQLQKQWLILKHISGYAFCLLTQVQQFLFQNNDSNQDSFRRKGCIFSSTINYNQFLRYYVQQDTLILAQTSLNSEKKTKNITIYSILQEANILKKGSYVLVQPLNIFQTLQSVKEDEQFIGLYRQYIIIVNSTTIRKFYLQIDLELVYEFTFNPEFVDTLTSQSSFSNKSNSYPIKYVLFLEKYLIVQFQQFYQLYNIGQQLISIQIAANNFKAYRQGVKGQIRENLGSVKNKEIQANVIINDAFLIEGDNIMIYEKDALVVAKYVTNPTLELGPFTQSQSVVETNLEVRLEPISDVSNFQDVYQQIMFKIIYSHYEVQNVAKNIKTLTVPSVTENYELEIWTFVFRGPVIQYYLSDTFDGQIVLKQHLTSISNRLANLKAQETPFAIIQYHRPFAAVYSIKTNTSHLLIEDTNTKTKGLFELPDGLNNSVFLKYLEVRTVNGHQLICLLSIDSIIFLKKQSRQNLTQDRYKIWNAYKHNISTIQDPQDPIHQTDFELMIKENNQFSFGLILRFSKQIQSNHEVNKRFSSTNFYWYSFNVDQEKGEINLQVSEKVTLSDQIQKISAIQDKNQIFILTQMQDLIVMELKQNSNETKFEIKQSIELKNIIPFSYRSNKNYVTFEIFSTDFHESDNTKIFSEQSNMTMLLFAQTDEAFHIEFEVFETTNSQNFTLYQLKITNIYASYQNFNFLYVVEIGFAPKSGFSGQTKKSYLYFVVAGEYEITQSPYLFYFGYNHNFSSNGQVGYFKCGEVISAESKIFGHIQNGQNYTKNVQKGLKHLQSSPIKYYSFSISSPGLIEVQQLTVTLKQGYKIPNPKFSYDVQVSYDRTFGVNTTIYMQMNYKKPPIVTYILLNARNFNSRAGIYTKFVFLKDQHTWMGFYISAPIFLAFIVGFGCMLKKYQPNEVLRKKKPEKPEIIYSDTSRSSLRKEEREVQISDNDSQDESSNNRSSLQDEVNRYGNNENAKISQKSSLIQSPFKSDYRSRNLEDLSQSQIGHSEEVRIQFNENQEKQILAYLIAKKGSNKNIRSSFA